MIGNTVSHGGKLALVLHVTPGAYIIEYADGGLARVRSSSVTWETGVPSAPDVANFRVASRGAGELVFAEGGWDVVASDADNPDGIEETNPTQLVWDPSSKSLVPSDQDEDGFALHPSSWGLDPFEDTELAQSPDTEGVFADRVPKREWGIHDDDEFPSRMSMFDPPWQDNSGGDQYNIAVFRQDKIDQALAQLTGLLHQNDVSSLDPEQVFNIVWGRMAPMLRNTAEQAYVKDKINTLLSGEEYLGELDEDPMNHVLGDPEYDFESMEHDEMPPGLEEKIPEFGAHGFNPNDPRIRGLHRLNRKTTDMKFAHIDEENDWRKANQPNLDECPDCGSDVLIPQRNATTGNEEGVCYGCGYRQPVINTTLGHQAGMAEDALEGAGAGAVMGGPEGALAGAGMAVGKDVIGDLMGGALGGGGGGGAKSDGTVPSYDGLSATSADKNDNGDDNVGFAVSIEGVDSEPDAGNKGFTDDHGDSPEIMKDVNDFGGTAEETTTEQGGISGSPDEVYEKLRPYLESVAEKGGDPNDPIVQAAHEFFKGHFGEDYVKKAARKIATGNVCGICHQDVTGGAQCPAGMPGCPQDFGNASTPQAPAGGGGNMMGNNVPVFSSVEHEAGRRPKMCPFHDQLVEYSLHLDDPKAALGAFAPLSFGPQSCQGGWVGVNKGGNEYKCKFKTEMVSKSYWDQKDAEAEEKRLQREQLLQQQQPVVQQPVPAQQVPGQQVQDPDVLEIPAQELDALGQEPVEEITQNHPPIPGTDAIQTPADYTAPVQPAEQPNNVVQFPTPNQQAPAVTGIPMAAHVASDYDHWVESAPTSAVQQNPVEVGETYEMWNREADSGQPDIVRVTNVDNDSIYFDVLPRVPGLGMPTQSHVSFSDVQNKGLEFKPFSGNPNALGGVATPENDDNTHAYEGVGQDDLSDHVASRGWLIGDEEGIVKNAGAHFSPGEQRAFIHEEGTARNLGKLDLSRTHYEVNDDQFLW